MLLQIYLTPGVEKIREYVYFIIYQLLERINETKKSYIDQIPSYPDHVFIPSCHYGLFKHRYAKAGNHYRNGMLVGPEGIHL